MAKRILAFAVVLVLCLGLVPLSAAAEDYIAANHTKSNGHPYYIMVNRAMNTVTVYTLDEDGYYTVPIKAMVCSCGRKGHATPLGTFSITGNKQEWNYMVDGTWGQYSSQFKGNYLFHSICYAEKSNAAMLTDEYNALGDFASRGCVRLQTGDAKWIYDNCEKGTRVTVYDGTDPGPLGKPSKLVGEITAEMANGWDPTDPHEDNPWKEFLLSYSDVTFGAWYYEDIRYVTENGLMRPTSENTFSPAAALSRGELLRIAESFAGDADTSALTRLFDPSDAASAATREEIALTLYTLETEVLQHTVTSYSNIVRFWDADRVTPSSLMAMSWAVAKGLLNGSDGMLSPASPATRAEAAAILHRYCLAAEG